MDLSDIRSRIKYATGKASMTDAMADYYIGVGIREVSSRLPENYQLDRYVDGSLIVGEWNPLSGDSLKRWIGIKSVWIKDTDDSFFELTFKTHQDLLRDYPKWGETDHGTPAYWTLTPKESTPDSETVPMITSSMVDIEVMPPSDTAYSTVRIFGSRLGFELSSDPDMNFFSETFPEVIIAAAVREYYAELGNSRLTERWGQEVERKLLNVDRNQVSLEGQRGSGVMNG